MDFTVAHHFLTNEDAENKCAPSLSSPTSVPASGQPSEFESALRAALLSPGQHAPRSALSSTPLTSSGGGGGCEVSGIGLGSPARSGGSSGRVLAFSEPASPPRSLFGSDLPGLLRSGDLGGMSPLGGGAGSPGGRRSKDRLSRSIPSTPSRILDAPDIVDDYYLNLISWSSSNVLAVALGPAVYTWNAETNSVQLLCQLSNGDSVTSVNWMQSRPPSSSGGGGRGDALLAVGCNSSRIELWDAAALRLVRTLPGHSARVASLSWNPAHRSLLSSGGRDSLILSHDVRAAQSQVATLRGHRQEVCGLKWSPDGSTLASGGNENYLCLWDVAMSGAGGAGRSHQAQPSSMGHVGPRQVMQDHKAAVKALAWAPFQRSLLASGGGTADRTIKFWNANTGALQKSVDTGSQVCSLLWSPHHRELVSSHGFSQNQLVLWKYPTMTKVKEFTGHTARVLHLDMSPDGASVVSAAADETLRFWSIFGTASKGGGRGGAGAGQGLGGSVGGLNMLTLR